MPLWKPLGGALALICGTAAAIMAARNRRYVTAGWLWFAGTLVPVIGLVHVGSQSMADRYTYIPLIGVFFILAWGAAGAFAGASAGTRRAAIAAAGLIIVLLSVRARSQVLTWRDDESLFRQIISVSPDAILAYFNLGNYYLYTKKDPEKARDLYEQALAIDPHHADIQLNLGTALARLGRPQEALDHFREAVRLKPDLKEGRLDLALALQQSGRFSEAEEAFRAYIRLKPDDWKGHAGLAEALWRAGDLPTALSSFKRARDLAPDTPKIMKGLGLVYGEMGDWDSAVASLSKATELIPDDASAWSMLGYAMLRRGDRGGASRAFNRALALQPSLPQPRFYIGLLSLESGDVAGARMQMESLRPIDPSLARSLDERIMRGRSGPHR